MGQTSTGHSLVEARLFDFNKDYDMIQEWWSHHKSFAPKPQHLVVEVEREPVCAGWVYRTDSTICVFEFVICDPLKDKETRNQALSKLIQTVKLWAKEQGFGLIYSSIGISSYIKRLVDEDFVIADKHQTHVFYKIEENMNE